MDQRTRVIDQDLKNIVHTRVAIAEKLELLEQRIKDTTEGATMTFSHLLDHTTQNVNHLLDKTKSVLDPGRKIGEHPWLMLGGALCVGYTIGLLELRSLAHPRGVYPYYPPSAHGSRVMPESDRQTRPSGKEEGVYDYYPSGPQSHAGRSAQDGMSIWDSLSRELGQEAEQVKTVLMRAGSALIVEFTRKMMPEIARSLSINLSALLPQDDRPSRPKESSVSTQVDETRDRASGKYPAAP